MSATKMPGAGASWAGAVACGSLCLYPAAWRARYEDEVRALLEDSGADLRTIASLAWQAVLARIWPPRHLYDPPARMRASLATVGAAWTVLAGLAAVFASFTQAQPWLLHSLTAAASGHPVVVLGVRRGRWRLLAGCRRRWCAAVAVDAAPGPAPAPPT